MRGVPADRMDRQLACMPARRQTVFTKLGLGKRHHARLSLATWFAPAVAAFAAEAPVLMEVAVDQDHTADWLRSGIVLAAVTGSARPAVGCNSQPLGAMRYLAACSPSFMERQFSDGVGAGSLARAPSLVFKAKDELQTRWAHRLCHRLGELPHHTLPSTQAFVTSSRS